MRFKEKASSIALAAILMGSSVISANAYMKEEIVGSNRYETAAKVADKMVNYSTAVLVNGNSMADGLSASGLAGKENAPILLVKTDSIPKETLQRLYKVKRVYIIGKENAVSGKVESSLKKSGMAVKRIGGSNRIDTSIAVSKEIGSYSKAFLVNGFKGEADAMSVASIAARDKAPIILTNGNSNPVSKKSGVKYYVVGGNTVMSNTLQSSFGAERLSGSNRYTTNKVIVKKFYPNTDKLYFAKGDGLVDALAVSPLAKNNGLALVSENSDKSVFYKKENLVQVGGMNRSIVDKVLNSVYNEDSAKPDNKPNDENNKPGEDSAKPDNKPVIPPEDNKPENKPSEKTYDINSAEFQKIVREEFYRLLDAHRAANNVPATKHHWAFEETAKIKSKHMIDNDYYSHGTNGQTLVYPHTSGGAECIHWIYVNGNLTYTKGIEIAHHLFNDWKNSTDHNTIMLRNHSDIANGIYDVDGFAFHAKWNSSIEIAHHLFNDWKNSTDHNTIMLRNHSDIANGIYDVDGFAFHAKWNSSENRYDLKATYRKGNSHNLWDTPDTTNPGSPGYQPKLFSMIEDNVKNIVEIFE